MQKLREFEGHFENYYTIRSEFSKVGGNIRFEYRLTGPLDKLVIPQKSSAPQFRDELWKHTCFEAFLQDAKGSAYWEFNFSPSRDWAIYRFAKYRERIAINAKGTGDGSGSSLPFELVIQQERYPDELIMKIDVRMTEEEKEGSGNVGLIRIGRVGLTAVLEHKDESESRSYWALTHCGDKPDFHAAESFIINL